MQYHGGEARGPKGLCRHQRQGGDAGCQVIGIDAATTTMAITSVGGAQFL